MDINEFRQFFLDPNTVTTLMSISDDAERGRVVTRMIEDRWPEVGKIPEGTKGVDSPEYKIALETLKMILRPEVK